MFNMMMNIMMMMTIWFTQGPDGRGIAIFDDNDDNDGLYRALMYTHMMMTMTLLL